MGDDGLGVPLGLELKAGRGTELGDGRREGPSEVVFGGRMRLDLGGALRLELVAELRFERCSAGGAVAWTDEGWERGESGASGADAYCEEGPASS
jgi:hypothetical protein